MKYMVRAPSAPIQIFIDGSFILFLFYYFWP